MNSKGFRTTQIQIRHDKCGFSRQGVNLLVMSVVELGKLHK